VIECVSTSGVGSTSSTRLQIQLHSPYITCSNPREVPVTKRKFKPVPRGAAGQALVESILDWSPDGGAPRLELRPDEAAILRLAGKAADTIDALNRLGDGAPRFLLNARGAPVASPLLLEMRSWNRQLAQHRHLHLTDGETDWGRDERQPAGASCGHDALGGLIPVESSLSSPTRDDVPGFFGNIDAA
jgi:hypothetical protein